MHNSWTNTGINVPAVYGAKAIVETGQPASTPQVTNACYNLFKNTTIYLPATQTTFGIYLQWTDSLLFEGTHIFGGSAKTTAVTLDYSKQNNMPSSCGFVGIDASGNGATVAQWANAGTPGPGARPNWVKGVGEIKLGIQPSLLTDMPARVRIIDTAGATSQIANAPLHTPYVTGMFRASFYTRMTAAGTAGTVAPRITVNDGVGAVNLDGFPGQRHQRRHLGHGHVLGAGRFSRQLFRGVRRRHGGARIQPRTHFGAPELTAAWWQGRLPGRRR